MELGPLPEARFVKPNIVKEWDLNMRIVIDFLFSAKNIQHGMPKSAPVSKLLEYIVYNAVRSVKLLEVLRRSKAKENDPTSRRGLS